PAVRLDAAVSYARHRYDTWQPRGAGPGVEPSDYCGNELELAPRVLGYARLTLRLAFLGRGSVALQWVRRGVCYKDPGENIRYDGHDLFNVHANVPVHAGLEVVARVSNLADARYAETSSFNAQQGERYRPGAPRQVFVGAQYGFGQ